MQDLLLLDLYFCRDRWDPFSHFSCEGFTHNATFILIIAYFIALPLGLNQLIISIGHAYKVAIVNSWVLMSEYLAITIYAMAALFLLLGINWYQDSTCRSSISCWKYGNLVARFFFSIRFSGSAADDRSNIPAI